MRPDPWDLRGDRVVAPEMAPVEDAAPDALVAQRPGTAPAGLAATDANHGAARSLMAESDARFGRMLGTGEGRLAMAGAGASDDHLGASDSTAGNPGKGVRVGDLMVAAQFSGEGDPCPFCAAGVGADRTPIRPCPVHGTRGELRWEAFPALGEEVLHCHCCGADLVARDLTPARRAAFEAEVEAERAEAAPVRPPAVTDVDEGEEDDEPPPKPVWKRPEPVARPAKDDGGFPIPPPDGELSAGEGSLSGSHYQSIEPALRAATIRERGMRTRIQITGYRDGRYVRGEADNFVVPDALAYMVREALEPVAGRARARFEAAVGAGTAPRRGGARVRIQLTEYAAGGGEYLRQDGSASAPQNLNVPGMAVADVAALVDHQLALHFGVRRGDAAALVRAWRAFAGEGPAAPASAAVGRPSGEPVGLSRPDLVGRGYDKRLHLGLFCVVHGAGMRVLSLWGGEADAVLAARRAGARVVDAEGWLVPLDEAGGAPPAAPDPEARL
jgi:hypothetical protein